MAPPLGVILEGISLAVMSGLGVPVMKHSPQSKFYRPGEEAVDPDTAR